MTPTARLGGAALLVGLATWLVAVAPAAGQTERLVTYAARSCPDYTDISANRARNDIQESLRDLGPDTRYVAGEPISPAKELAGQPRCRPLPNWRFVLGTGYQSRAVTGPWGSLSKVLNPYGTSIVTQASTPLLDSQGNPTGAQLPDAVTVALTEEQAQRATAANSLWLQGGAVDDPVLDKVYPGAYGFGALRCAIDNLNGDNVEWIAYPQGARHVFCYAYYVTPPPTSGTILVRKVVDDPQANAPQTFTYGGNISFESDNTFSLTAKHGQPGSTTFIRAAVGADDPPWAFKEQPTTGWERKGLACSSANGGSSSTTSVASGAASVRLAAGDTVTCTYTNRLEPPRAGLVLSKVTLGGTGAFDFSVAGEDGTRMQRITTTEEGVPRAGSPLDLAPGDYTVSESLPAQSPAGRWVRTRAACDGTAFSPARPVELTLQAGQGSACQFTNRFVPAGSISIDKVTFGGVGTFGFVIRPVAAAGAARSYEQRATTTEPGQPVRAKGDGTAALRLGTYEITETGPPASASGHWTQEFVLCDGEPVAAAQGRARVRLTSARPDISCTFGNRFVSGRPPSPGPSPDPDAELDQADGPFADLAVTKDVAPRVAPPGAPAVYTLRVTNRGPDAATDVVGAEVRPPSSRRLDISTTQGVCRGTRPAACRIGTLEPGESATITVRTTAPATGRVTNRVAVLSSVKDPNLRNNWAAAALVVRASTLPPVTG